MKPSIKYDILLEGAKVKGQIQENLNPIVEARNLLTAGILCQVLQALSDSGFYEFVSENPNFEIESARTSLNLEKKSFYSLLEYLAGLGAFEAVDGRYSITDKGRVYFNVYTRGILTVYLGGYNNIFFNLSDVLTNKVSLSDSLLKRSTKHAAVGTAYATATFTIPKVFETLRSFASKGMLDLGCGSADFLINFLKANPGTKAWGVDMSVEALAQGREKAKLLNFDERIRLYPAEIGKEKLPVPEDEMKDIDFLTSMYMLHEFGREGDQKIVEVLCALAKQFSNKRLLILEVEGVDPTTYQSKKREHNGQLDYLLIHELSLQGLPKPQAAWLEIFERAKLIVEEKGIKIGGSFIYVVKFP